jgi:hypothetical protein
MEKKSYSKIYTQFETQAMAYGRVKAGLKNTPWFIRGNSEHLMVFQETNNSYQPLPVLKIVVRASTTPDEVGFFKLSDEEVVVVGMDRAWDVMNNVLPLLTARGVSPA